MPVRQPHPSALAQAVPPPMVLSIGRNPADAQKLAQINRNAVHPGAILGDFNHLLNTLMPPQHVTMGGQQHQAGAGMIPNPEEIAARLGLAVAPLRASNFGSVQLRKALADRMAKERALEREERLKEGELSAHFSQYEAQQNLIHDRIAQQMPWMTEPSLNLRQWMMEAVNDKGGKLHPLLTPTVKGGTDTQKALLDFFIQHMKNKPPTK